MILFRPLSILAAGFLFTLALFAVSGNSAKKMTANEAISKWGNQKFENNLFKAGNIAIRAKMASDLVENNQFRGKSVSEVWENLGYHDGHYINDVVPAYILNDDENDVWQLIFLVDENRVVTSAVIYKNCCEK